MTENDVLEVLQDDSLSNEDKAQRIIELHDDYVENAIWVDRSGDDF